MKHTCDFSKGRRGRVVAEPPPEPEKVRITIRLDEDLIDYFGAIADRSGGILLVFQGRPRIPGIEPGARLVAEGMVGAWGRRLAILNPDYELVAERDRDEAPPAPDR